MVQWKVFSEHVALDQKENDERLRDLAEYAMAFHNYEAVSSVQNAREQPFLPEEDQTERIFLEQVQKMFGKNLEKSKLEEARSKAEREEIKAAQQQVPYKNARQRIREDIIKVSKREEVKKDE